MKSPTFNHVVWWVEDLWAHARNKADFDDQRAVPIEDAVDFVEDQGLFFSEASALSGDNVDRAFLTLLNEIDTVVSRKALESTNGRSDNRDSIIAQGSRIEIVSGGADMEISETKKFPICSY